MATSTAATPDEYVASLPEHRRRIVSAIRETINSNLPDGYREGMSYGMIGWYVPPEVIGETIARADLESFTGSLERVRGSARKSRKASG